MNYDKNKSDRIEYPATQEEEGTVQGEENWDDAFRILNNPDVSMGTKEAMIRERYTLTKKGRPGKVI